MMFRGPMDHELHDVSRVIERRMLSNAGFM